jgi:uncharacterized membrane protein
MNWKKILTALFGAIMIIAGVMHFIKPGVYAGFIPDFLPSGLIIYGSGVLEILVGVGVFIPRYRSLATASLLIMMIAFLPLHVIDVFRENPAVQSHEVALIRLPIQFVLILWAWYINKRRK